MYTLETAQHTQNNAISFPRSKRSTVPLSGAQITLTAAVHVASSPLSKLISHTRCSLAEAQVSKQVNLLTIPKT